MTYDLYVTLDPEGEVYAGSFTSEDEANTHVRLTEELWNNDGIEIIAVEGIKNYRERDTLVPQSERPRVSPEFPLATQLADPDEAQRTGIAIANLLELSDNDYPGDQIRFDTVHGDRTYEGLARIVARVFEDPQFALELATRGVLANRHSADQDIFGDIARSEQS